eukprot:TRINITY_DN9048_c0_g1_i1.p2 TRINITY_DN9048_c0_g1~~TRINITY_DN9048_c0_g1_i1.p2  ORF type:complete len:186 (-),score=45.56 TRINITY_DN9048_c0_g1_i1:38-595(-)
MSWFRKFTREDVSGSHQVKTSVQRGIRASILEQFPMLDEESLESLVPKKAPLLLGKCHSPDHVSLIVSEGEILFFQDRDGALFPTLRLLHRFPGLLPRMQVDKGAIRFVLQGAQIMCPGLTSPGGNMSDVDKDIIVGVFAEGKEHALAVGRMMLSTESVRTVNKGPAIDNIHYLTDGLWQLKSLT